MNIQTFALQGGSTASVTSQLESILADERPSLLIGYGNADLSLDTGCGIEKHALQKLFEPFYTTKPTCKGTGLGLYISFSIVVTMGGTIAADSEVNVGTTFTLSFLTNLANKKPHNRAV